MNHPELVHGLELLPCAIRDGMLYIPHADGNWVSAAKLQPFSLAIIGAWRTEQALTPCPAPSAAPHQGADALREALAWLVRLEDERIRLQNLHAMGHGTDYNHYHKTLPLAWATARAALAHHQAPQQGEPK